VKNAMENVSFVTPMCDLAPWSKSATNVIMAPIREDVLFVVDQAFQTLITVKSVFNKKRIGMDAQKL
jgi:hypothetical protein